MHAIRTKAFKSGNSVAVRLPKALGIKEGEDLVLEQMDGRWTLRFDWAARNRALVDALRALPPLTEPWVREPIEFPDRPGLYGQDEND